MDLVAILSKTLPADDTMTPERAEALRMGLHKLGPFQAKTALSLIRIFRNKYDPVRRMGENDLLLPYYGQPIGTDGVDAEFSLSNMPMKLQLILEKFLSEATGIGDIE